MPRSRVRGGRKAHNKRIKFRNQMSKHYTKMFQKKLNEAIQEKLKSADQNTNNTSI